MLLGVLMVQVVDSEVVEVADDDRVRALRVAQGIRVPLGLAERGHGHALARLGLVQVDTEGLLLDHGLGVADNNVDEPALSGAVLEPDVGGHILHADHVTQQLEPERGRVALLVAATGPLLRELLGRALTCGLPLICHVCPSGVGNRSIS